MPPPPPPPLSVRLREETAAEHRRLETVLDLLTPPLTRERFRAVVAGFHGFHAAWEPAVARAGLGALGFPPPDRLAGAAADLRALGLSEAEVAALPVCDAAADLAGSPERAIGSLYVIEGSALGGKVISRALAAETWAPPDGLRTFDPFGDAAGPRWRAFKARLDALPDAAGHEVVAGARAAFVLLADWLPPRQG